MDGWRVGSFHTNRSDGCVPCFATTAPHFAAWFRTDEQYQRVGAVLDREFKTQEAAERYARKLNARKVIEEG